MGDGETRSRTLAFFFVSSAVAFGMTDWIAAAVDLTRLSTKCGFQSLWYCFKIA